MRPPPTPGAAGFMAPVFLAPGTGAWVAERSGGGQGKRNDPASSEMRVLSREILLTSGTDISELAWAPVDDATATEVRLYAVKPNAIGLTVAATFPVSQTSATLVGLAPGVYQFALLARDEAFTGVARSGVVTATLVADPPAIFLPIVLR